MASFKEVLKNSKGVSSVSSYSVKESNTVNNTINTILLDVGTDYIKSDKYVWYEQYNDEDYSFIDSSKNIKINSSQINLTQEENSQVIPFIMDRYCDGIDLMGMFIQIHFVNTKGQESNIAPINVMYNSNKIKFYFLVPAEATAIAGKLKLEIIAQGTNEKGQTYKWRTKPNEDINILESLVGNGIIEPTQGWDSYIEIINQNVLQAQAAAQEAKEQVHTVEELADDIKHTLDNTTDIVTGQVITELQTVLEQYYTSEQVDELIANLDFSSVLNEVQEKIDSIDGLANLIIEYDNISNTMTFRNGEDVIVEHIINTNPTSEWTATFRGTVKDDINASLLPLNEELKNLKQTADNNSSEITNITTNYYTSNKVDELLQNKANSFDLDSIKLTLKKNESIINSNSENIGTLGEKIGVLEESLKDVNTSSPLEYDVDYNVETGTFQFIEVEDDIETVKRQFVITGGSNGGSATTTTVKIERITPTPLTIVQNDKAIIKYSFSSIDSSGDTTDTGTATWKVGSVIVANSIALQGENEFDLTPYVQIGSQKITLSITDSAGTISVKTWTVQVIDVRLETNFNDEYTYPIGDVSFSYTPYGSVSKNVHFILDGNELDVVPVTLSGLPLSYTIPSQEHGSHLLETYISCSVNNTPIETEHIYKDIIWYDENNSTPVIGCSVKSFTLKQYDSINLKYVVYDPQTETPMVTLSVDDQVISTLTLTSNIQTWQFKSSEIGEHTLTITCGDVIKTINATITEIGIDIEPVSANLAFDFNPFSYSNSDIDRIWSYGDISMAVSDNFDWVNGGYQIDENGDKYFCVKSGTTATINYNLFEDDSKKNGKEFKVVFRTTNIRNRDTSFISCMNNGIGLDMKIENATIYSNNSNLYSPYCEDDTIEFEFNINKDTDIPLVLTYEDGVGNRPMIYTSDASYIQPNPQPITIGSEDCDVYIYRMKAYSASLSDRDILSNFIADARNAEEMIQRYNRNQIYDENGLLTPDILAEACPDLRIIIVDAPWFTNDKSNKVDGTTVRMIYKNGDPVLDNWICTGAQHSGQGTSSNEYGYSGRNLDLIMNKEETLFTLGDGVTTSKTITLSRNSVPTDYLNVKVNIASSENANNAQFAKRYNEYNPFKRTVKIKDGRVKDTMEFYNCVVFIRENNEDIGTHREFTDTNYHFYGIGNVGDSKKTDNTRVNDKNDPKECILEITDYNVALAEFPTGKTDKTGNKIICPESEWKTGNTAYDYLYAPYKYKDGEFKSFGSESYEFRYEKKGITEEERQVNIDAWRDFYKFVVTSDDEKFKADFEKYFVKDSALYFYLFTERYLMVDNRAKNSFWHYGKVWYSTEEAEQFKTEFSVEIESKYIDDSQATFNDGYRWDLAFAYDMDTASGIDNTGKLVLTYGKEDIDYYVDGEPSSSYIYRAAESTFFCRVRDLFPSELQAMFVDRENANAWSADNLITQWDKAQSEFVEELWRLDIRRKYLRTYQGISIDNSIAGTANPRFLTEMLNGRKKYQRRMFERNQELYMATKYFGNRATQDQIMMRFNNPIDVAIKPNFTLKITPYSNMYIGVKFGNVTPINIRAKAGIEYTIPYTLDTADITLIYGASFIQAIGDLSKCYVGDNDFSKASRLQKLVIGSDEEGYINKYMTKIALGNNPLIEYLDLKNIAGLNSVLDLSQCSNLLELYAEGTNATGVIFANGGKIQTAHLPSIISLNVKNLNYITNFEVNNYDKLETLIVENTPLINTYQIVSTAKKLNTVRLIGLNWDNSYNIADTGIFEKLIQLKGIDSNGYTTINSVLTGFAHVVVARQKYLSNYNKTWNDLSITYDTLINQYTVTFKNYDGSILDIQYVDKGGAAVDPITRDNNPINTPVKPSTTSTDFTYSGWDLGLTNVFADRVITAQYIESVRHYTITYKSKNIVLEEKTAPYGSIVDYSGDIPMYTDEEPAYIFYLFKEWDQSGFVNGDKVINAVYDKLEYTEGCLDNMDISEMTPVQIYAMTQLGLASNYVQLKDSITFSMGHDYSYSDIQEQLIISEKTIFSGSNYIDTGITLLEEDRDWVIAIDYKWAEKNANGATLVQCYQSDGSNGFKLNYSNQPKVTWGISSTTTASVNKRDMIVLRHIKGETRLHVYAGNLPAMDISYSTLTASRCVTDKSTLVLGCVKADDGIYENYAQGIIYWCKIWYSDLGDLACRKMAEWTHESTTLEVAGFRRFYLSDGSTKKDSITFLASHLLENTMSLCNSTPYSGGWSQASLNNFLNTRFYKAIPTQFKQLFKEVKIPSIISDNPVEISNSNCYVSIPAIAEIDMSMSNQEPYPYEGEHIDYIVSYETRQRKFEDGTTGSYFTRSMNFSFSSSYFYTVNTDGYVEGYDSGLFEKGVLVMLFI